MKIKGMLLSALLAALLCFLVSGCGRMSTEINDFIVPPSPSGKLSEISSALYAFTGKDITLRYPKSGEYRSAFIVRDIDGDANDEALAFYSTISSEKTNIMHVNFIAINNGKYRSVKDFSFECSAVNSVSFTDLSGDGVPEIIITWTVSSSPINKISVFGYQNGAAVQYMFEDYSTYITCDIDGREDNDLLIVTNDPSTKTAEAKVYKVDHLSAERIGYCRMDPTVQEYYTPVFSKLGDGTPAVYIDANKGTEGTITELLFFNNSYSLINPFVNEETGLNTETLRSSISYCSDFNDDGVLEIPRITRLPDPPASVDNESVYLTEWLQFVGANHRETKVISYALIDYTEGYSVTVPEEWVGKLSVRKNLSKRERAVYFYDPESEKPTATEIFKLKLVDNADWKDSGLSERGYFAAAKNARFTVAIKIENGVAAKVDETYFSKNIKFIS